MTRKSGSKRHHSQYRSTKRALRQQATENPGQIFWASTGRYSNVTLTEEQWEQFWSADSDDSEALINILKQSKVHDQSRID